MALVQCLLPRKLLTYEFALFQCYALEDVIGSEMDATGCGKFNDVAMSLCLTQQFNPLLCVGFGNNVGAFDGLSHDFHHVAIVAPPVTTHCR